MKITKNNVHYTEAKKLKQKKYRDLTRRFLIEGEKLLREAVRYGVSIVEVYCTEDALEKYDVLQSFPDAFICDERMLAELSETVTPQGIAAVCIIPSIKKTACDYGTITDITSNKSTITDITSDDSTITDTTSDDSTITCIVSNDCGENEINNRNCADVITDIDYNEPGNRVVNESIISGNRIVNENTIIDIASNESTITDIYPPCPPSITSGYADNSEAAIILENIQDPLNVGAILRSAAAVGYSMVYLCNSADPFSQKALRAGMSAQFILSLIECPIEYPLSTERRIYCADMEGEDVFTLTKIEKNHALVFGNEGNGVSQKVKETGKALSLKMENGVESLNVAAAATVFMYLLKQKV